MDRRVEHSTEVPMTRKKTAKDWIGKRIMLPVKRFSKGKYVPYWKEHRIDADSAQRIAKNVNLINDLVDAKK